MTYFFTRLKVRPMKPIRIIIPVFFFLILTISYAGADVYSWVDENGVKHYSNSEPENPEGKVEKTGEIEHTDKGDTKSFDYSKWRKERERKKREEDTEKQRIEAEKQAKKQQAAFKAALDSLQKVDQHVAPEMDWDKYKQLMSDAENKIAALTVTGIEEESLLPLRESLKSHQLVLELQRLELTDQDVLLIRRIKQMNSEWGTDAAHTYHAARKVCWERATEKLNEAL